MTGEVLSLLLLPFVLTAVILSAISVRRGVLARKAIAWIRAKYGDDVQLLALCEIWNAGSGPRAGFRIKSNRVAAAVAMAGNVIAWRSVVFDIRQTGEIQLADIDFVMWGDAASGLFANVHLRRRRQMLTVKDRSGIEYHFVFEPSRAAVWEKVLEYRIV